MSIDLDISEKRKRQCAKLAEVSKEVIRKVFDEFSSTDIGVTWTGGKDSGLVLWLIKQVCDERKIDIPKTIIIGEGDEFEEIEQFVEKYKNEWNVPLEWCRNDDVLEAAKHKVGAEVVVEKLNERNRKEIERIDFKDPTFEYEAESFVGNHLMKTTVFNLWLEENNIKAVFQGLRWDEHVSRFNDEYMQFVEEEYLVPEHTRIRPILHFTEKDIWDAYAAFNLPYCKLYEHGYRSLGAKSTSIKTSDDPAWEQDLQNTEEREGRHQEKETIMDQLRALGYM